MNTMKTLKAIERKLASEPEPALEDLHKAYGLVLKLRSQLLGAIYDRETFGGEYIVSGLAELLSEGVAAEESVTLTVHEPLPSIKELTSSVQDHWLELIHTAIRKASQKHKLTRFEKAFVWIEVITPHGTNNANLWDTSNRAINLIINNLKGIFFEDDNLEHMAFGVTGRWGENGATVIKILPYNRLKQFINSCFTFTP